MLPANWKFAAEQFCSDMYHAPISHASAALALAPDDMEADDEIFPMDDRRGRQFTSRWGHGTGFFTESGDVLGVIVGRGPGDWFQGGNPEVVERLGHHRALNMRGMHATLFPTFSFLPGVNTMRVWHPKGPNEMEVWVEIEPPLAVFNVEGVLYAIDDTCTHAKASLSDGDVEGCMVECPFHMAQFDLRTGRPRSLPASKPVRTHAVEIRSGTITVLVGAAPDPPGRPVNK